MFSAENVEIGPCSINRISTDIDMKIDCKLVGKFCSHSSLSIKSIEVGAGVVDSGYQEIIYVVLHNLSREPVTFDVGDKIAQILFEKVSLPVLYRKRYWWFWQSRWKQN